VKTGFAVLACLLVGLFAFGQEVPTGAWVDQVVFQEVADASTAFAMIEAGELDLFAYALTDADLFARAQAAPEVFDMARAYGVYVEITLNPYGPEFNDGRLNPFSVPAIREALNWLIDREYIAEEIYQGLAIPRYTPVTPTFPDYPRYIETFRAIELRYQHDPDRAREIITREMEALGAELVDGVWHYKGEPVEIIGLIRVEDERLEIGDYIATLLEDLGFVVRRDYKTSREAAPCWIFTDPAEGCFHYYTAGWVTTAINRDQGGNFDFFYTTRGLPFPLWQAYTPDPEFDEICDRLGRRDFTTLEERAELFARAVELALKDSVRVWVVHESPYFLFRKGLSVASDLAGGVYGSWLWAYAIRWEGQVGGTVNVGVIDIINEPWNPIGGTNWIYDMMPIRGTADIPTLPDPYTGLVHPQRVERAEVTVKEGLPVGVTLDWVTLEFAPEIQVPEDAWIDWDATEQRFITVGEKHPEGLTALTKTVIYYADDFLGQPLHDGSTVDIEDIVLGMILTFDRAKPESAIFDESAVPGFESFQQYFKGVRIVSEDPLVIETYMDLWYLDAEYIADAATWDAYYDQGPGFWHVLAIGILAEGAGELAFTADKADTLGVEWMNLIAGPSLEVLMGYLDQAIAETFIPYEPTLGQYITEAEAQARYQNLLNWYNDKGHFWVSNGPFYLADVDPVAGIIVLEKFADFPDPADKWLVFGEPMIPEVEIAGPRVLNDFGSIVPVHVTFKGEPYPTEFVDQVKFLVFDANRELAYTGMGEYLGTPGEWVVNLPASVVRELPSGTAILEVVVTSKAVAIASFAKATFLVP
jgi:peptide/nickel transport system substrate-binding protein